MTNFEFHNPWFFTLFLLFIPLIIKDFNRNKSKGIAIPSIQNMKRDRFYPFINKYLVFSKYLVLATMILAMARPRNVIIKPLQKEGIDIVLAVDISLSMLAKDFQPDRLTALKELSQDFVNQRENDRIGLTVYAGEAFMKVPLTTDHQAIIQEINEMKPGDVAHGTAIGEGLAVAAKHLINSSSKSKIVILMTDGMNTVRNAISEEDATLLAKNNNIRVYTIGIGTNGYAESPVATPFGDIIFMPQEVEIDEEGLTKIAQNTGGKYFRATNNINLEQIYNEINTLEKTEIHSEKTYEYEEFFRIFLTIAIILLMTDNTFRWLFFKKIN